MAARTIVSRAQLSTPKLEIPQGVASRSIIALVLHTRITGGLC